MSYTIPPVPDSVLTEKAGKLGQSWITEIWHRWLFRLRLSVNDLAGLEVLQAFDPAPDSIVSVPETVRREVATVNAERSWHREISDLERLLAYEGTPPPPFQVHYGTHAERLSAAAEGLWFETDRKVLYGTPVIGEWGYLTGCMKDVIANRPIDLLVSDVGFEFRTTDAQFFTFWTGTEWLY